MEHKTSREKAWVASKKRNNNVIVNDGSYDEINNLQDDSFVEQEEGVEEAVPLTEEEIFEIRKKIGILLVFVFIAFLAMIFILIFDPFAPKKKKVPEKEIKEEVKEKEITLYDYEDGKIVLSDKYISSIYSEITFNVVDNYEYDTYFLFRNNTTNLNTLSDAEKIILASKTNEFNSILEKISTSSNICEETISIDSDELANISQKKYGTTVNLLNNFKYYNYYYNGSYITSIYFTLENGKYNGKCYDHGKTLAKSLQQELISATKDKDNLYLDVKVVFITEKGVFKDPNFKYLITNDKAAKASTYMQNANTYRFNYIISKDGYYLNNVTLLK